MVTDTKKRIITYIAEKDKASAHEITRYIGFSPQIIHRHLKDLVRKGELYKSGKAPKVFYSIIANPDNPQPSEKLSLSKPHEFKTTLEANAFWGLHLQAILKITKS